MTTGTKAKSKNPAGEAIKAATTRKAKGKTEAQKESAIAATAEPGTLLLVPIELIDTHAQVRTEFEDNSIAELAADIAVNGILQPVLLNRAEDRFVMIAGERRLRAARLAKLTHLPAMVGQIDAAHARRLQLAENIQREDLSLNDLAKAVRSLFDELGSLQAVADACHKSKPWASKHVALSEPDLAYSAKQLLEDGSCEDLETLHAANQLAKLNWREGQTLCELIRQGKAGRTEARERLKAEKQRREDIEQKQTNTATKNTQPTKPKTHQANTAPRPVEFMSWTYMREITDMVEQGRIYELLQVFEQMNPEEWAKFESHHRTSFDRYATLVAKYSQTALQMALHLEDTFGLEHAAAIWAITGQTFDLANIARSTGGLSEATKQLIAIDNADGDHDEDDDTTSSDRD